MKRAWAEIDLKKLEHNLDFVKSRLKKDTIFMAVVKANAYGHGAVKVAKFLNKKGIEHFAVANLDEAIELRKADVLGEILILGYTDEDDAKIMAKYDLTGNIGSFEQAKKISKALGENFNKVKYHISVNTGMNRLGFNTDDKSIEEIAKVYDMDNIKIVGIGSHLLESYAYDDSISYEQIGEFDKFLKSLKKLINNLGVIHMTNSFGALYIPKSHYDMVRVGSVLFNLAPKIFMRNGDEKNVLGVLSLKANIVNIRQIKRGETVGYDRTFTAKRDSKIAVIPLGYVDGIYRKLENNGRVIVNGEYCDIVGAICMDSFMIDITDVKNVEIGTTATIVGTDGDKTIDIHEQGERSGSNECAFCTRLGRRIKFEYKNFE
ncbi:MAG: alanine racemase [Tissierellia bacterium]|nr:alanine racemase [Tissierellia bacterium]